MDRSMVAKATSSDDSPTPGYMYGDIAAMTHADFEGCRQLHNYLLERMKKPNHNVKFKCLNIIKHVCMKGRAEFKISMQRDAQPIKDCLTYSGPPDPLRGEEIYRKVREAAKDTLEAVFAEGPPAGANPHQPKYASGNRIEGFGSAGGADPPGGGGGYGYNNGVGGSRGFASHGGYGYDGGYDGGYNAGGAARGAASSISAVGSAMGAVMGKAVGSITGRSSKGVGLVGADGGYGGGRGGRYGGGGGSTMVGMGNYDPSKDKTWLERTSETVKDSVGTGFTAVQRRLGRNQSGDSHYESHSGESMGGFPASQYQSNRGPNAYAGPMNGGRGGYRPEAVSSAYEDARASSQAYASQWDRGVSSGASNTVNINGGVRGVWGATTASSESQEVHESHQHNPSPTEGDAYGGSGRGFVGRTGGGDSDGGYEGKLVEEICAAGGTKSTPGKQELDSFLSKAASLDPIRVAEALQTALAQTDWRARSKALAVIEALHRSDPSYRIPLEDTFGDPDEGVIPLCGDPKPAVRDRAVRVSRLLGLDPSAAAAAAAAGSDDSEEVNDNSGHNGYATAPDGEEQGTAASPSGPAIDLLGGGFESANQSNANGDGADVVDILGVGSDSGGGGGGGGGDGDGDGLDDFLGMAMGAQEQTSALNVGRKSTTGGVSSSSQGSVDAATVSKGNNVDVSSSLFEDLSVKDGGDCKKDAATVVNGADPGVGRLSSGFSFMANGEQPAGTTTETAQAAAAVVAVQRQGGDDDLLSGFDGGNSPPSGDGGRSGVDLLVMSPTDHSGSQRPDPSDQWLGLDSLPGPAATADNGSTAAAAAPRKGDSQGASANLPSLLDWAGGGGIAANSSAASARESANERSSLLGGGFSGGGGGGVGGGAGFSPEMLQLQRENQFLQQQVMMMQTGGGSGVGLGGLGAGAPSMMRPQMGPTPSRLPRGHVASGAKSTGGGILGAGMIRPGAPGGGKTIPDSSLWGGVGVASQPGFVSGIGVGEAGAGQHGRQQQQQLPKAPDSFNFVRDAMENLIK